MAWRYKKEFYESGDVIGPRDWNNNQNEYASEWNGYLDRDNLPTAAVTAAMIKSNACNRVTSDAISSFSSGAYAGTNDFKVDIRSNGWTTIAASGSTHARLNSISLLTETDRFLIAEWSGWWSWTGEDVDEYIPETYHPGAGPWIMTSAVMFRITSGGVEIARSGWFAGSRNSHMCYLVGAIPLMPGAHTVQVEVKVAFIDPYNSSRERIGVTKPLKIWDRELITHERMR